MAKGIYEKIGELAGRGSSFVLCRVTAAEGSTPRGEGAVMAVQPDGTAIGSVGGGKIEYDCISKAREMMGGALTDGLGDDRNTETLHFDLYPDVSDNEYICGGRMDIELSYVSGDDQAIREMIAELVREHRRRKVYIFGGGHVAQALVPVLAGIEFAPIVYEERKEFASTELFPEAEKVICHGFDRLGECISLERTDFCAIMTRGHTDDYTVLKQVLSTDVEYVGLMGSRSKRAILFNKLTDDGFGEDDLARIYNPIGLDIGSETPEEIAISIAAELIAVRAAEDPKDTGKNGGESSPDPEPKTGGLEGDPKDEYWGDVAALFAKKAGKIPADENV